jgi:hypothetical protein
MPVVSIGSAIGAIGVEPPWDRVVIAIKVKAVTGTSVSRERRTGREEGVGRHRRMGGKIKSR